MAVRLVGIPDVTVTDCEQYITFSSRSLSACSSLDNNDYPLFVAAASSTFNTNPASSPPEPTSEAQVSPNAGPVPGSAGAAFVKGLASTDPVSDKSPGTYYAAHWYDVARSGVPSQVRVETCNILRTATETLECTTASERWSVSPVTKTVTSLSVASFSGVRVAD